MKKLISWLLVLTLSLTAAASALAAAGDRTLVHYSSTEGMMENSIANVFLTEDGILAYLNGMQQKILLIREGAEPEEYLLEEEEPSLEQRMGTESFDSLQTLGWFSWQGGLYALQYRSVTSGETNEIEGIFVKRARLEDGKILLEDCDIPTLDLTYSVEDYGSWKGVRYMNKLMTAGNLLAGTAWDQNGNSVLLTFDLTTGEAQEIPLQSMDGLYPGPEGSLLMTRYEWGEQVTIHVIRYDIASQSEEELGAVSLSEGQIQSLCMDEQTNTLYFVANGEIRAAKDMNLAAAEAVSDCPMAYDATAEMMPDGRLLLWNSGAIVLRNPDPAAKGQAFTLNIQDLGYADSLNDTIFDFLGSRGDAAVVLRRTGDPSAILQAMMNRDASVDIYTLPAESSVFDALRSRGFLADLSGNADLSAAAERLVPYVQQAVRQDGRLTAVPAGISGGALGIRLDVWKKLGGTEEELPKTWMQFFDWLETLPARLEGTDNAVFDTWLTRDNFRSRVLQLLLNQYQATINGEGRDYAFDTPLLRGLLERVDALDWDALGLPAEEHSEEEGGMMDSSMEWKEPLLETWAQATISSWSGGAQPLLLALEEGAAPVLPVNLTVAFVNPYSEHADAAAEFLAMSLKNLPITTRYSLFTDQTEPVRDPYYEENRKNIAGWLEEAKAALEKSDEETRFMWEESVKDYQESLDSLEENSWMISGDAISAYAGRADCLQVLTYDFASALTDSGNGGSDYYSMIYGWAQGQVSAQELLSGIDKKVQMMRLEGN